MAHQLPFPNDGIRYQDQEQRYVFPAGGNRELEVLEIKFGFIPGHDQLAYRVRRRYRFVKGGHPQLVLIHYSRGQPMPIIPSLAGQSVRSYPLRPYNEPAVFVLGDRQGQKVYPGGLPGPGGVERSGSIPPNVMGMGFGNPQAMLAQQNNAMEALERRSQRERDRSASMSGRAPQPRPEDDDSADEQDLISTRTLALTRYRRNHEYMNEVFMQAAFRNVLEKSAEPKPAYAIFKLDEIEAKIAKTTEEVADLEAKAAARKAVREADERADIAMDGLTIKLNASPGLPYRAYYSWSLQADVCTGI
ncbi:hypothetical protein NM688_g2382 [Phlebia brevispora]|uniref:Uncharacterized protein n=1 Tax=Phlebia brevispora TaxID=194682 RepID=A0ACC1T8M3_9APHY|nr:hypothetical protein NM688_g2382 [Phlebia brevispora]